MSIANVKGLLKGLLELPSALPSSCCDSYSNSYCQTTRKKTQTADLVISMPQAKTPEGLSWGQSPLSTLLSYDLAQCHFWYSPAKTSNSLSTVEN